MTPERWQTIRPILESALELRMEQRVAFLDSSCSDASIRAEVESLLASNDAAGDDVLRTGAAAALDAVAAPVFRLPAGTRIGAYEVLAELAVGGMGAVYKVKRADGQYEHEAALKIVRAELGGELAALRFRNERQLLARFNHPNIAKILDGGVTAEGIPYLVMELVAGQPITTFCDQHRLSIAKRIEIFLAVCSAVHYAHQHFTVHRDIKPHNILVNEAGVPKLLDFGIAKMVDGHAAPIETPMSELGINLLTPDYASPEQFRGEPITTATDVYALGLLLYELLCGQRAVRLHKRTPQEFTRAIERDPTKPSEAITGEDAERAAFERGESVDRLRRRLRGDLDNIVMKAIRKEPAQRYSLVPLLADDLQRHLDERPVHARSQSYAYRTAKFVRRHRGVSVVAIVGALLAVGAGLIAWGERAESMAQQQRMTAVRDFMFELVDDVEPDESRPDKPVTGKQLLDGAVGRAHRNFSGDRRLQGELLSELGRKYGRLREPEAEQTTLTEALLLLEQHAPNSDQALNKTRAYLASVHFVRNERQQASRLAKQAYDGCSHQDSECAKARAYANTILSRIALVDGRADRALLLIRESVADMERGFGADDPETALGRLNLVSTARSAGQLLEADHGMKQVQEMTAKVTLTVRDREAIEQMAAAIDTDLGRYESARRRLTNLLSHARTPAEKAIWLRMLAGVFLALGQPLAAIETADAALTSAQLAGSDIEVSYARQAHARALALTGDTTAATSEIDLILVHLRNRGIQENTAEIRRARRIRSEILLRAGHPELALQELRSLEAQLIPASDLTALELGQTLDLLGCALRELQEPAEARTAHGLARAQLAKQLANDHPLLLRNSLYMLVANHDRATFAQQAKTVRESLPQDSIWRQIIDAQLVASESSATQPAQIFLL